MERFLGRYSPFVFAFIRIFTGLMVACHGAAHVFGMFAPKMQMPPGSLIWVAGAIELVCGFLVAFGLFGGWAAFLVSGTLACAYFMAHVPKGSLLPIVNGGDPAVLYCFIFLYIACHGSGILSLDQILFRRTADRPADRF